MSEGAYDDTDDNTCLDSSPIRYINIQNTRQCNTVQLSFVYHLYLDAMVRNDILHEAKDRRAHEPKSGIEHHIKSERHNPSDRGGKQLGMRGKEDD